jgi:hypothetical protein
MKKEITVVIPNHPFSREYNQLGGAIDIKTHNWTHVNVKFLATSVEYSQLLSAFSTSAPFELLGWDGSDDCTTKTISRWTVRESPVAKQEGDSLWLSFECLNQIPDNFFQYLSNKFQMKIQVSYCPPYMTGKWLRGLYKPSE